MFRTQRFIFRKNILHIAMVQYILHASVSIVFFDIEHNLLPKRYKKIKILILKRCNLLVYIVYGTNVM